MKNKKSRELVKLILKVKENEKEMINKLSLQYLSTKNDWCLNEMEKNHRLAITSIFINTMNYMLEKQCHECFYKTENGSKFFVMGINYEDNYLTGFNLENLISPVFDEITKAITTDEKRKVEYVDSTGVKYYAPTFSDCYEWIEMILENLQNGNL